ncbi:Release factor H-coupled RctB family protein [Methylobacterium sp. AMS5]|nr:Release factor H-coupled RctB family protein [Methylobacterium sp. AMS5]
MHGRIERVRSVREGLKRNPFGGIVVCEDRNLLIEEAGDAYKAIDRVIDDLVSFGLAEVVATFRPLVTFKTGLSTIGRRGGSQGAGQGRGR